MTRNCDGSAKKERMYSTISNNLLDYFPKFKKNVIYHLEGSQNSFFVLDLQTILFVYRKKKINNIKIFILLTFPMFSVFGLLVSPMRESCLHSSTSLLLCKMNPTRLQPGLQLSENPHLNESKISLWPK